MIWTPDSWKNFPIKQQPQWPEQQKLDSVLSELGTLPPLVFAGEIDQLKLDLAEVVEGKAFLLQGGDCAEDFNRCNAVNIRETMKVILQMAVVLAFASNRKVVKIGRMAGQYGKPRSSDLEDVNGISMPSYRGDSVNAPEGTLDARTPDPQRLLKSYFYSTATLNLLRAYVSGGYADLHKVHLWNKEFVANMPAGQRYDHIADKIDDALRFMDVCGIVGSEVPSIRTTKLYTSHEALILPYEQALTRRDSLSGKWYDCSAHMVWIGERTRELDGAHMEFFRGINNPIGVKVGPTANPDTLCRIAEKLNPENIPGRLTFISRMGHKTINDKLPGIVEGFKKSGYSALWSCDPMHGNTFTSSGSGLKTRDFQNITEEVKNFFHILNERDIVPGGIHLELTGDDVTEVCGGMQGIRDEHLAERYRTNCDPRLNCQQSLEMAYQIADMIIR